MAKTASLLEPAESLQGILIEWGKGKTRYRVHQERYQGHAFNPTRRADARFIPIIDRSANVIPTLRAAGSTLDCALMETVFHNVPYKPGFKQLSFRILDGQVNSALILKRSLHLIDLGRIALQKLGIKRAELIDTTEVHYPRTRGWGHRHSTRSSQMPKIFAGL